jgi:hypothetical protein
MIQHIFSDTSFNYYQLNGVGSALYLGNWSNFLPSDVFNIFDSYDWSVKPTRNYDKLKTIIDFNDEKNKPFIELSHFSNFKSSDNCQWKIEDYKDIILDKKLFAHLDTFLKNYKVWVTQIPPGCCIPQHIDTVDAFLEEYQISKSHISNIKRYVILPESSRPWHHLWYGNTVIPSGQLGDVWSFNFWEPHGGSNLGSTNKYTIQIMGI